VGSALDIKVSAVGLESPSFQWLKNGSPIAGATQNRYRINSVALGDAGTYTARVTNSSGSISADVVVSVVEGLTLVQGLQNQMVAQGAAVNMAVQVQGPV